MFRHKVNKRRDRRIFSKTAKRTNKKNMRANPMRGGFRI